MREDIRNRIKHCRECQLAKGLEPSRQGLLLGKHHNRTFEQINLDLVGPIGVGKKTLVTDDEPARVQIHSSTGSPPVTRHAEKVVRRG